jgi:hypothetical protein
MSVDDHLPVNVKYLFALRRKFEREGKKRREISDIERERKQYFLLQSSFL